MRQRRLELAAHGVAPGSQGKDRRASLAQKPVRECGHLQQQRQALRLCRTCACRVEGADAVDEVFVEELPHLGPAHVRHAEQHGNGLQHLADHRRRVAEGAEFGEVPEAHCCCGRRHRETGVAERRSAGASPPCELMHRVAGGRQHRRCRCWRRGGPVTGSGHHLVANGGLLRQRLLLRVARQAAGAGLQGLHRWFADVSVGVIGASANTSIYATGLRLGHDASNRD
mmetsp:Transcript_76555/g.211468  ORF Transcript_76555/g.211468 Transcript_76555/m.211468 type:complete len:227 (-) Transcript_76555:426-1106(-)